MPYLNLLAEFRDNVRKQALKEKSEEFKSRMLE